MSSNGTDSGADNSSGNNGNGPDYVSIVALVISVIALISTVLQVLQQYFASATGYARCGPKVMSEWAKYTKRILRMTELRFEVQFETPVIFLAPPNNTNKPIKNRPLWYVYGTDESYKETRTLLPEEAKDRQQQLTKKELIHTADNEQASWVELLMAVQKMERDSDEWQRREYLVNSGRLKPPLFEERTLAVAVQAKRRSWDTMPSNMAKPYATTTICHMVELAAVLGLHWKEFDRNQDKYRAEGNGFVLANSNIRDLGIVFSFLKTGKTRFEENRIIPKDEIKQFCFGVVPTIYCDFADEEHLKYPFDEPRSLTALQLGSKSEVAETFTEIGCNTNTVNYFLDDKATVGHLFPMAFEVLGMLGRTIHASGSAYRMLPNPTVYTWDKKSFSMWKLLQAFKKYLEYDIDSGKHGQTEHLIKIQANLEKIFGARIGEKGEEYYTVAILDALHEALNDSDDFLTKKHVTKEMVLHVLRAHIQFVLATLNAEDEEENLFKKINSDTPEHKQNELIKIYFREIRPKVLRHVLMKRASTLAPPRTAALRDSTTTLPESGDDDSSQPSQAGLTSRRTGGLEDQEDRHNTIWCTLIFRMLCWLLLHDFHRKDVQISKSELLGSRLPVYIA